jgi:hypothetical protein
MQRDLVTAVRELCLAFPESSEVLSHGAPDFRVRGKTFASFLINHHGDGRIALWLALPEGAQAALVAAKPKHYFVPPYVGHRGWVGVRLDQGLSWREVGERVREAWDKVAPPKLAATLGATPKVAAPDPKVALPSIDPLDGAEARAALALLRELCLRLPDASEGVSFGSPVWKVGGKTFAMLYAYRPSLAPTMAFRVGVVDQGLYTGDPRYSIPKYMGHNGWIALAVGAGAERAEVAPLVEQSYRHFAGKKQRAMLDGSPSAPAKPAARRRRSGTARHRRVAS